MLVNFVISQRVFLSKDAVRVSRSSLATLFHKLTFFVMNIHINYFKLSMFVINMMKISWNKTFPIFIIIINIIIINSLKWKQIQRVWTRKEKKIRDMSTSVTKNCIGLSWYLRHCLSNYYTKLELKNNKL